MTALLAFWLCGVCLLGAAGVYYSLPPSGARPNVYEVTLWILSGTLWFVSATILVMYLVTPVPIQPGYWLP